MLEEILNPDAEQGLNQAGSELDEPSLEDAPEEHHDPLDQINDPEKLRHEAKKYRGIAARKDKTDEPAPSPEPTPTTEFMTKRDFYRVNERAAIAEIKRDIPELEANFDAVKAYYVPRRGKERPEDIVEDLKDALVLFKARNPGAPTDPSAALSTISVTTPTGTGTAPITTKDDDDPRFAKPKSPESWYK